MGQKETHALQYDWPGAERKTASRGGLSKIQYGSLLPFFHNGGILGGMPQ